jgi:hypothetical protein
MASGAIFTKERGLALGLFRRDEALLLASGLNHFAHVSDMIACVR